MLTMEIKDQGVLVAFTAVSFPSSKDDKDGVRQQTNLFGTRTVSGFDPLAILRDVHGALGKAVLDIEAQRREQALKAEAAAEQPTLKFPEPDERGEKA